MVENLVVGNPQALSLANSVTADPPGIFSIHFNPAGLALVKHNSYTVQGMTSRFVIGAEFGDHIPKMQEFLNKNGWVDPAVNTKSKTAEAAIVLPGDDHIRRFPLPVIFVPTGGIAWHAEDSPFTWGTAAYSPYGAGYMRKKDDSAQFWGQSIAVIRLTYASPTVAIQFNDHWFFGAGFSVAAMSLGAESNLRVPNIAVALVNSLQKQSCPSLSNPTPNTVLNQQDLLNICGGTIAPFTNVAHITVVTSDLATYDANFGLLWQPTEWFAWGATYRTPSEVHAKGRVLLEYTDNWVGFWSGLAPDNVKQALRNLNVVLPTGKREEKANMMVNFTSPAQFSTGIKLVLVPNWQVNLDLHWMDWGKWNTITLNAADNIEALQLVHLLFPANVPDGQSVNIPRGYKSVWNWSAGVQHRYSDALTLRAGFEPRKSSIPADKQDILMPLSSGKLFTVGAGYKIKNEIPLLENSTLDLALGYFHAAINIPGGTSSNLNSLEGDNLVYNPYAGTNVKTSMDIYLIEASFTKQF